MPFKINRQYVLFPAVDVDTIITKGGPACVTHVLDIEVSASPGRPGEAKAVDPGRQAGGIGLGPAGNGPRISSAYAHSANHDIIVHTVEPDGLAKLTNGISRTAIWRTVAAGAGAVIGVAVKPPMPCQTICARICRRN